MNPTSQSLDTKRPVRGRQGPDPVDVHVGSRLRLRRNLVGMSQDQLGSASNLTFQQIQKYERGANRMSASRLYQLAKILNVTVTWFFDEMPPALANKNLQELSDGEQAGLEDAPPGDQQILQRRETLELIRAYYRITDRKQRRKVYDLVKSMAGGE
jgi:transcriptional regulator with XRE-family HTH domain